MRLLVLSCLLLASTCGFVAQAQPSSEGKAVTRIDFDPPDQQQPLPREELDHRIAPLQPGEPLRMADVHEAIQNLYLTGRYHDISVEADPDGDGVRLRFVTTYNYFVSRVAIDGEVEPPNREQLRTASKLDLGAPFRDKQVDQAVKNMLDRLHANGLYQAQVSYRVDRNPLTEEASLYFAIDSGDRARFDGVKVAGTFTRSVDTVIRTTGWRRGLGPVLLPGWRQLTEQRLQTGISRVRDSFQKGNRLEARVTLDDLIFHEDTNRVTPSLHIEAGPILEVKVTGSGISNGRLRQLIPIYQERTVDRSLLLEGQRNLTEHLESKGYFDAQLDFTQSDPEPGRSIVEYLVTPGARHKLAKIEIDGNHYFDDETLRERLSMSPASFLRDRWGHYSQRLLDRDKTTIADLYHANGFREAKVTHEIADDYNGKPGNLAVKLQVEEGPQWFVGALDLEGITDADADYLKSVIQSNPGQPYSEAGLASDRDAILGYYFNNGYPDATFDYTETPGESPTRVNLKFVIHPGKRQYVRNVLVRGLENTDADLVANRILLAPGDAISQSRIGESQQKLYDLGIFSKVQTAIQNPDGEEDTKYVLFHLDEARKYSFNFGFGAELGHIGGGVTTFDSPAGETGFSPRVSVGLSRLNFLGLGHTVGIQTLASTLEQRALLTYLAPQFRGNENLSLTFSGLFDDSRDVRTFTAHRLEGSVQLAQRLSRANTLQYRYTIRRVTIPESTLKISELIPLLSQPDRAGIVSASFIQDRRDDPTNSTKGYLNSIDGGWAWKGFGSETDYTRLVLRNSTYHKIRKDIVLARSTQLGYIRRLGGLPEIPLAERFFSGGASSHRAFPDNQAGPRDLVTGFPLGGNALLFNSTEIRFPLIGDNLGGVFFHDMGNVYSSFNNISLRFVQKNNQDFDYGVHAFGFGIRYRTPVGPIRADFSLSPNSPRFVGFSGTREQLLSNQFGDPVPQRINAFQFHFSLGQTF